MKKYIKQVKKGLAALMAVVLVVGSGIAAPQVVYAAPEANSAPQLEAANQKYRVTIDSTNGVTHDIDMNRGIILRSATATNNYELVSKDNSFYIATYATDAMRQEWIEGQVWREFLPEPIVIESDNLSVLEAERYGADPVPGPFEIVVYAKVQVRGPGTATITITTTPYASKALPPTHDTITITVTQEEQIEGNHVESLLKSWNTGEFGFVIDTLPIDIAKIPISWTTQAVGAVQLAIGTKMTVYLPRNHAAVNFYRLEKATWDDFALTNGNYSFDLASFGAEPQVYTAGSNLDRWDHTFDSPGFYQINPDPNIRNSSKLPLVIYVADVPAPIDFKAVPFSGGGFYKGGVDAWYDGYVVLQDYTICLRDLAYLVNGTEHQIEVAFDSESNAFHITTGRPYTPIGGEHRGSGTAGKTNQRAVPSDVRLYIDGERVSILTYSIDGHIYFSKYELEALLGLNEGSSIKITN